MKKILSIIAGLIVVIACLSFTIISLPNPEDRLVGAWQEVQWEYDRVYHEAHLDKVMSSPSSEIKSISTNNKGFGEAERWHFNKDGSLTLIGDNINKKAKWKIKGRGNILQIIYGNNKTEQYNIITLSNNDLVLNFDTNSHIQGIAKITCKKI